ncbi:MAG: flavin reductase family protein [Actinomycetota bacterium]|nr:flavin reductase family protein [Actinomycetota bacterium]
MTVAPEAFREALSKFASGVTIVTVAVEDALHGMTASSFASVSLDPPLILVVLDKTSHTRELVRRRQAFAVNVLGADQETVSRAFARSGHKPFDELTFRLNEEGIPLLDGAIAWIECRVFDIVDGGDHDIVIGDVRSCATQPGTPLIYYERAYRSLAHPETELERTD